MPDFSPERWQRVEALLDDVLDLAPAERAAWLDVHCGGDAALRAEVEALLKADEAAPDFLDAPVHAYADALVHAAHEEQHAPDVLPDAPIGPYRLVRVLGHGGMGTVYLAKRADGQFEQQVAVKLIKRGMDSDAVRRRFLAERQILARLQHPHIARLLDGGMADDGRSYFVMDYVGGTPITDYSTTHGLDLGARLRLFEDVCSAVEYAHRNLVVHRDLKPSNILVTSEGQVKLLDFGIAKMLADEESPLHTQTDAGLLAMTPEYAAPEQVRGEAVTTATDVYALGVVLYELLTGERPYHFPMRSPTEIERVICDTEPNRPSTAVLRRTETTEHAPTLHRKLRGDLDNIVLKALRKEPDRRYPSASHLLDDLRRYRDGLPVLARPDTVGYRMRKFVQRHRVGVAMTLAFVLLSVGFASVYTFRIAAERDRAQAEAQRAREARDLLVSLFGAADPDAGRGDTLTTHELLALGTAQVEAELANQPDMQAEMLASIGEVYRKLGSYDEALPLLERALAQARDLYGSTHEAVATAHSRLGELLYEMGEYDQAETHLREALRLRRQLFGEAHADVAHSLDQMAALAHEQGDFQEAENLYRQALALRQALFGPDHLDVSETQNNLGILLTTLGKYDEAETVLRQALIVRQATYGDAHSAIAETVHNLGFLFWDRGLHAEAEPLFRRSLSISRRLYGETHPSIAIDLNNLSLLLRDMGDYDQAEALGRQALAMQQQLLGPTHRDVSTSLYNLADLLMLKGAYAEAESLLLASMQIDRDRFGDDHPYLGMARTMYSNLLLERDALDEAEAEIERALSIFEAAYPEGHYRLADARVTQGRLALKRGQPEVAEQHVRAGLAILASFSPDDEVRALHARNVLGRCLTAQRRFDEAETLLQESYEAAQSNLGVQHQATIQLQDALAMLYLAWDRPAQAARYRSAN